MDQVEGYRDRVGGPDLDIGNESRGEKRLGEKEEDKEGTGLRETGTGLIIRK